MEMNNICPICYDEVEKMCVISVCKHSFCESCISEIVEISMQENKTTKCPLDNTYVQHIHFIDLLTSSTSSSNISDIASNLFNTWLNEKIALFYVFIRKKLSFIYRLERIFNVLIPILNVVNLNRDKKEIETNCPEINCMELIEEMRSHLATWDTIDNMLEKEFEHNISMYRFFMSEPGEREIKDEVFQILESNYMINKYLYRYNNMFIELNENIISITVLYQNEKIGGSKDQEYTRYIDYVIGAHESIIRNTQLFKVMCLLVTDISGIEECSTTVCILCLVNLGDSDFMQLKQCHHSICMSCIYRFMVKNCDRIFTSNKSETFWTDKYSTEFYDQTLGDIASWSLESQFRWNNEVCNYQETLDSNLSRLKKSKSKDLEQFALEHSIDDMYRGITSFGNDMFEMEFRLHQLFTVYNKWDRKYDLLSMYVGTELRYYNRVIDDMRLLQSSLLSISKLPVESDQSTDSVFQKQLEIIICDFYKRQKYSMLWAEDDVCEVDEICEYELQSKRNAIIERLTKFTTKMTTN